ncbi:MAG: hypothetical protein EA376_06730 [Phycisphaeraceae bacterium]|nr:MAG: hypothetical protein EA376_06730 [Phycisphaeraceae bacterium]
MRDSVVILPWVRTQYKRARRSPLHASIRGLTSWTPMQSPEEGFTVVVGCMHRLAPLATANLRFLEASEPEGLREIILVFDCVESDLPATVKRARDEWDGPAPLRIICYSDRQAQTASKINWGWVYSWLSWSIGVGAASTRHVLLHDLDAFPVDPGLLSGQWRRAVESGAQFTGVRQYSGNGVDASMNLVTTFELVLDAAYVRERFHPFDAFNKIRMVNGRYIDFDTFLHMQHRSPSRAVAPVAETALVHPSQLICHYTDFISGRDDMKHKAHNLMMLPYFAHIGSDSSHIRSATEQLERGPGGSIMLFDRELPIAHLAPAHWAWMEKQIQRMALAIRGAADDLTEAYLKHFVERAGDARTVGRETGEAAVPAR